MKLIKLLKYCVIASMLLFSVAALSVVALYIYLEPELPSIEGLSDVRLQVPLRIYSSDGALLGEFGEKRRTPKTIDEIPKIMKQAFLAAEDDRFFEHPGVDYQGILRAVVNLIKTGERGQGGSTITMQLARNFYLSSEKTYARKVSEIFLALRIERELSKEKILELYLNKIYLGNRSYGVAAAAEVYYGKKLEDLSLAQTAMIAGLPKAPSSYNPIVNKERAMERRDYVLGRMYKLEIISDEEFALAKAEPSTAERHYSRIQVQAPYVNEMVRAEIVKQFGEESYNRGLRVYTTVTDKLQTAANDSLWKGLVDYDQRHGFRGVLNHVELHEKDPGKSLLTDDEALLQLLDNQEDYGRFEPALVLSVGNIDKLLVSEKLTGVLVEDEKPADDYASILLKNGERVRLPFAGVSWAKKFISLNRVGDELKTTADVLKPGDIILVSKSNNNVWTLGQGPEIQGAFVAVAPNDGAILALTGGFNFHRSNFNRAIQARRQAGSSFKPFIYAAALNKDFTPASIINDAPVVFEDQALEGTWRPENYSGTFHGPTRLREALYKSRNLVSIRILRSIGIGHATRFARKFGFNDKELPRDLSLALGSCEVSPLQLARAYSVFANGGYLVQPYFIQRIEDADGTRLFEADPAVACVSCELEKRRSQQLDNETETEEESLDKLYKQAAQTIDPGLTYQMNSILRDVVLRGTGRRALELGRKDLAGKTGTTNDQKDAWFNGFNQDLVAITWVGFDQLKPLGNGETGSKAALPIWVDFMKVALDGVAEKPLQQPEGLVTVKINAQTGEAATDLDQDTIFEVFRTENAPVAVESTPGGSPVDTDERKPIPEQLF